MSLERKPYQSHLVGTKELEVTSSTTLTPKDQVVLVDTSSAAVTVTLPSVAECRGLFFSIRCSAYTSTGTIQDQDDSAAWAGDITFDAVGDKVLLYSDGMTWHVLSDLT